MKYNMKNILVGAVDKDAFVYSPSEEDISNITNVYNDVEFNLPIEVKITIQNRAGYMTLHMLTDLIVNTNCARCNSPVEIKLGVDVTKTISDEKPNEDEDENLDYIYMDEDKNIDISTVFAEQVVFDMPFRFLCKEDCKGLCPKCGINLNQGTCDCDKKGGDPRLAILKTLLD